MMTVEYLESLLATIKTQEQQLRGEVVLVRAERFDQANTLTLLNAIALRTNYFDRLESSGLTLKPETQRVLAEAREILTRNRS